MTKLYGSLEAGGTKFVCAVGDENFNVVEKTQFPTLSTQRDSFGFLLGYSSVTSFLG